MDCLDKPLHFIVVGTFRGDCTEVTQLDCNVCGQLKTITQYNAKSQCGKKKGNKATMNTIVAIGHLSL